MAKGVSFSGHRQEWLGNSARSLLIIKYSLYSSSEMSTHRDGAVTFSERAQAGNSVQGRKRRKRARASANEWEGGSAILWWPVLVSQTHTHTHTHTHEARRFWCFVYKVYITVNEGLCKPVLEIYRHLVDWGMLCRIKTGVANLVVFILII
jgi:hypothetical protein